MANFFRGRDLNTNRRGFISGASALVAAAASSSSIAATSDFRPQPVLIADEEIKNCEPELARALDRLREAETECEKAERDLQWLADEWRHVWPLAPECILGNANADKSMQNTAAERDIIGNLIFREVAELGGRLRARLRNRAVRTCFAIDTPEQIEAWIERIKRAPRSGKTDKTKAKIAQQRDKYIAEAQNALPHAIAYQRATADLRERSGANAALARREVAKAAAASALDAVFETKVNTLAGLKAKAVLAQTSWPYLFPDAPQSHSGIFGSLGSLLADINSLHSC